MKIDKQTIYIYVTGVGSVIAGFLHATVVAFAHVAPLPLETVFFVLFGVVQLFLGVLVTRRARLKYMGSLFVLNGALAIVWLLSRVLRAPFMDTPESVRTLGLFVFGLEVVAMMGAAAWKWSEKGRIHQVHGYSFAHVLSLLLLVAVLSGSGMFGTGRLGEVFLPDRALTHSHGHEEVGHEDGSDHQDDNHVDEKSTKKDQAPKDDTGHEDEAGGDKEDSHDDDDGHGHN